MPRGVPHAWKVTGAETGRVLFLYAPAVSGKMFEESQRLQQSLGSVEPQTVAQLRRRYGSETAGPPPF
jgi:hypothetical protein